MSKSRLILKWLLLIFFPLISFGQSDVLQFQEVALPESLAQTSIRLVEQDNSGLLWLVTMDGLYRYDGQELLKFDLHSTPALPALPITAIRSDHYGNLWLGFHNGAARFNLKNWTITTLACSNWSTAGATATPQDKDIASIACTIDGKVYFGTQSGQLYVTSSLEESAQRQNPLQLILNMSQTRTKGQFNAIMNIQQPVAGQLWLGTGTGMLVYLPVLGQHNSYGQALYFKPKVAEGHSIGNICYDSATGKCLFSAGPHLCLADIGQWLANQAKGTQKKLSSSSSSPAAVRILQLPEAAANNYFSPFYIDADKAAVLTDGSLSPKNLYIYDFKLDKWKLATPYAPVQFPGKQLNAISSQGQVTYVSSAGGLTRLQFQKAPVISLLNGFDYKNSIRSVYRNSNYLYLGSYRDRFIRYDLRSNKLTQLSQMYIYSILPWNSDTLILATEGNGLYWYLPSQNKFRPIQPEKTTQTTVRSSPDQAKSPMELAVRRYMTALCRVNDRLLLAGSYHGLLLLNPYNGTQYPIANDSLSGTLQGVKVNAIIPITPLPKGAANNLPTEAPTSFLIASDAGVFQINTQNGQVRTFLAGPPNKQTRHKAAYSLLSINRQIWIGTNGYGILMADSLGKRTPSNWLNKRLTSQVVYTLAQSAGYILIGTDKGLNVLRLKDSSLSYYTTYSGLAADEFNQSAICSSGSSVYLGTVNGLVYWNAHKIKAENQSYPFSVTINRVFVTNKNDLQAATFNLPYLHKDAQDIRIPAGAKYFSITFGKPDQRDSRLAYYYRLRSTDKWTNLGSQRSITFVRIQPGDYQLQFAARSPAGTWMESPTHLQLIVQPAYYQTFWFKILIAGILVTLLTGLLILLFRFREKQQRKERDLRIKIAGDLHDEVGSALTRIWHQAQNAQQQEQNRLLGAQLDANTSPNNLDRIASTSQEAINMMSDIVWSIDAHFDTREQLILRMKSYVYQLQEDIDQTVTLMTTSDATNKKISQVIRQNLFLLFKEGINNAIKYGDGQPVNITMEFKDKIKMRITNTYDSKPKSSHNQGGRGIANMQRRVKNMHGVIKIIEEENRYTLMVEV